MKRKTFLWVAGSVVLIVIGVALQYRIRASRDELDLQEQLRLARAEGLPTNAVEFMATIEPASPAENAAPLYRHLKPLLRQIGDTQAITNAFLRHPTSTNLFTARRLLTKAKPALDIIDQAAALPRCWFDRNWSEGLATLLPEYADMKAASRLLALRGSIAAADSNEAGALSNGQEILQISKHSGEEGTELSALVSEAIYLIDLHALADWCVLYPTIGAYRGALEKALKAQPRPNLRRETRDRLWNVLSIIDLSLTKGGRRDLGLKEDDVPVGPNLFSVILSQAKARTAIVHAERDYWATLKLPHDQRGPRLEDAKTREGMNLLAFPVAAQIHYQLGVGDDHVQDREPDWQARQLEYTAVLRALPSGAVARSIKTSDLKSPYDGKPLTYRFDGEQIHITINGSDPSSPTRLTIPPDELKRQASKP